MSTYPVEQNLEALTSMASNLTPYLYEDELFGHLGNNLPKLTVGGMLMRLHQLKALESELNGKHQQELHDAEANINAAKNEWSLHYEQKILREIESRLGALRWYTDDCTKDPVSCANGWRNEAEKRTIVAELVFEAKKLDIFTDDLRADIAHLDGRLRQFHKDGDFLWDDRLETAYPKADYWWLYGYARGSDDN